MSELLGASNSFLFSGMSRRSGAGIQGMDGQGFSPGRSPRVEYAKLYEAGLEIQKPKKL